MNSMIEAGMLTKAIADHIKPIQKGCHVKNIGKAIREHHPDHPNNWRHEDLSQADSKLLADIWTDNGLPFNCVIEQANWPKYKTAFDESPNRPNWELTCGFNDWYIISRSENAQAAIQHMKAIEAACAKGELRLFTPNLVPTSKVEYGTLIRRDDAVRYLESIGLSASILEDQTQEMPPEDQPKRDSGRPKDPMALANRLDELKEAAISEARRQGSAATIPSVASALACSHEWCRFSAETLIPEIRAGWWK